MLCPISCSFIIGRVGVSPLTYVHGKFCHHILVCICLTNRLATLCMRALQANIKLAHCKLKGCTFSASFLTVSSFNKCLFSVHNRPSLGLDSGNRAAYRRNSSVFLRIFYVLYGSTDLNSYLRNTGHLRTWVLHGLAAWCQRSYRPYIAVCLYYTILQCRDQGGS